VPREDSDDHHYDDNARHDEYARKRLSDLRENYPEYNVQKHDLDCEPHLVVYKEYAEETAYDRSESEVRADPDIAKKRISQVDVITDEEGHKHSEYPSSHEAFDVVIIRHPTLDESEAGTEEEESDREDTVVVEEYQSAYVKAGVFKNDHSLVEHDKDCKESLEFLGRYTVEESCFILGSSRYSDEQQRSEKSYADNEYNR